MEFELDPEWVSVQWDLGRFLNNSRHLLWSKNNLRMMNKFYDGTQSAQMVENRSYVVGCAEFFYRKDENIPRDWSLIWQFYPLLNVIWWGENSQILLDGFDYEMLDYCGNAWVSWNCTHDKEEIMIIIGSFLGGISWRNCKEIIFLGIGFGCWYFDLECELCCLPKVNKKGESEGPEKTIRWR
jgi:hypothetical protein